MDFLETILKEKKDTVAQRKRAVPERELLAQFKGTLAQSRFKSIVRRPGIQLIAEIKRASPSKGGLRPDLNVTEIAALYEKHGVELVSVLAEEKFFKGSLDDIAKVSANTGLSVLCKDFIIDEYQLYEAKLKGADAVLLIAAILDNEQIAEFIDIAESLQMDAVVEVHSEAELKRVLELGSDVEIIGINHRNLHDFSIDMTITEKLIPLLSAEHLVIAESGISQTEQIKKFDELGVDGVLVGESLMRSDDIAGQVTKFTSFIKELNNS